MYTKEIALQSKNPDFRYTFFGGVAFHEHTPMFIHTHGYRTHINIHLMTISVCKHLTTKCSSTFGTSLQRLLQLYQTPVSATQQHEDASHTELRRTCLLRQRMLASASPTSHTYTQNYTLHARRMQKHPTSQETSHLPSLFDQQQKMLLSKNTANSLWHDMLLSLFIAVVQQLRSDIQQDIAHLQLLLYTAFQTTTWNALVVYITTLPCQTSQQQNLHTYTHTENLSQRKLFQGYTKESHFAWYSDSFCFQWSKSQTQSEQTADALKSNSLIASKDTKHWKEFLWSPEHKLSTREWYSLHKTTLQKHCLSAQTNTLNKKHAQKHSPCAKTLCSTVLAPCTRKGHTPVPW